MSRANNTVWLRRVSACFVTFSPLSFIFVCFYKNREWKATEGAEDDLIPRPGAFRSAVTCSPHGPWPPPTVTQRLTRNGQQMRMCEKHCSYLYVGPVTDRWPVLGVSWPWTAPTGIGSNPPTPYSYKGAIVAYYWNVQECPSGWNGLGSSNDV